MDFDRKAYGKAYREAHKEEAKAYRDAHKEEAKAYQTKRSALAVITREQKQDVAERIQAIVNYASMEQQCEVSLTDLLRMSPDSLTAILAALRRGDLIEPQLDE